MNEHRKSILNFLTSNSREPIFIQVENEFFTSKTNIDELHFFLEDQLIEVADKSDLDYTILSISLDNVKQIKSTETEISIEYLNNSKIYISAYEKEFDGTI